MADLTHSPPFHTVFTMNRAALKSLPGMPQERIPKPGKSPDGQISERGRPVGKTEQTRRADKETV